MSTKLKQHKSSVYSILGKKSMYSAKSRTEFDELEQREAEYNRYKQLMGYFKKELKEFQDDAPDLIAHIKRFRPLIKKRIK